MRIPEKGRILPEIINGVKFAAITATVIIMAIYLKGKYYDHSHTVFDHRQQSEFQEINVADAYQLFFDKQAIFVDARSGEFYRQVHIPNAISLPLQMKISYKSGKLGSVSSDTAIIVYCDYTICGLSTDLAIYLSSEGFDNVYRMGAGIDGWIENGLPIDRLTSKQDAL